MSPQFGKDNQRLVDTGQFASDRRLRNNIALALAQLLPADAEVLAGFEVGASPS